MCGPDPLTPTSLTRAGRRVIRRLGRVAVRLAVVAPIDDLDLGGLSGPLAVRR
jgi:hypothetical protein